MGKVIISDDIEQKLDDLIGREWMYNGRTVNVRGYTIKDGEIRVKTENHPIVFPESKAGEELKNFLETEAGPGITKRGAKESNMAVQVFEHDSKQMSSLEEIIMDNIQKVKDDPKYVPQAKVITNNVNTMINLNKQKIEMIKEIRKHGG